LRRGHGKSLDPAAIQDPADRFNAASAQVFDPRLFTAAARLLAGPDIEAIRA